jgi:hypothetical protein
LPQTALEKVSRRVTRLKSASQEDYGRETFQTRRACRAVDGHEIMGLLKASVQLVKFAKM